MNTFEGAAIRLANTTPWTADEWQAVIERIKTLALTGVRPEDVGRVVGGGE